MLLCHPELVMFNILVAKILICKKTVGETESKYSSELSVVGFLGVPDVLNTTTTSHQYNSGFGCLWRRHT